jgi:hypothetical protein
VAPRISRRAEDGEIRRPAGSEETNGTQEEDMLFGMSGSINPAIRAAVGVVILVIGLVLHKVVLDAAGAAAIVISVVQWLQRRRGTQGTQGTRGPAR